MQSLKRTIQQILTAVGYKIVRADAEQKSQLFNNVLNMIGAYEYIFNTFRHHDLIKPNKERTLIVTRLLGTPPPEAYFLIEAIYKTCQIKGDVCEFGVAQGETSALIANEIRDSDKKLHLFDSFEGLPAPTAKDQLKDDIFNLGSMNAYKGSMSYKEHFVIRRLREISYDPAKYVIHKGFIKKLIHEGENLPGKVTFAYIDFDFYEPILVALNWLHSVMPAGGIIIVDDYNFFSTGVKAAIDEFVREKNVPEAFYNVEIPDKQFGHFAILNKIK